MALARCMAKIGVALHLWDGGQMWSGMVKLQVTPRYCLKQHL